MKIGLKIPQFLITAKLLERIQRKIDYIEYNSPSLAINKIFELTQKFDIELLPHSVSLSTTSNIELSKSLLNRLKDEVNLLKPKYLGEHLGTLHPGECLTSLGYIHPPKRNEEIVKLIARNIRIESQKVGIDLAIENTVHYVCDDNELDLLSFYRKLDKYLPENTYWILDIAHLYISAHNLNVSFEDLLNFFISETSREIKEVHLSNVKFSENNVCHDNHFFNNDLNFFKFFSQSLNRIKGNSLNVTIELEASNIFFIIDNLDQWISIIKSNNNNDDVIVKKYSTPLIASCREEESTGRVLILKRRVFKQLATENPIKLKEYFNDESIRIWQDFYSYMRDNNKEGIPYYDLSEQDGIDILLPFLNFIKEYSLLSKNAPLKNFIATQAAIKIKSTHHYLNLETNIFLVIHHPKKDRFLYYQIEVNDNDEVIANKLSHESYNLIYTYDQKENFSLSVTEERICENQSFSKQVQKALPLEIVESSTKLVSEKTGKKRTFLRSFLACFFAMLSSVGDSVFLVGLPLFFFYSGDELISQSTLVVLIINLTLFLSRKNVYKKNSEDVLRTVGKGELSMGIVELILLGIYYFYPNKYLLLFGIVPLAYIYNSYAPSKFFRLPSYLFNQKITQKTSILNYCNQIGFLIGILFAGFFIERESLSLILIFDASTFILYGVYIFLLKKYDGRKYETDDNIIENKIDHKTSLNGRNFFKISCFVALLFSWMQSSIIPVIETIFKMGAFVTTVFYALAVLLGGFIGSLIVSKNKSLALKMFQFSYIIICVTGIFSWSIGTVWGYSIILAILGLYKVLVPTMKREYYEIVEKQLDDPSLLSKQWVFDGISTIVMVPLAVVADGFISPFYLIIFYLVSVLIISTINSKLFLYFHKVYK